ncbi:MAG TPA: hypothetical protein PK034_09010 [Rugosibacter sp.]|nr:hypothetical protein [Rugosibacter sp.]
MAINFNSSLARQRPDLSDAIYQYRPVTFKADEIFPPLAVSEQKGQIEVVTRESLLKIPATLRVASAAYNRINEYLEPIDYDCKEYGLEIVDSYGSRQTVQYNRERGKMLHVTHGLLLDREKKALDTIFDTATWTGAALYTDVTTTWATVASADIIGDVYAAKKKVRDYTGVSPNAVIMSELNYEYCLRNKDIRASIQYTAAPTIQMVANSLPGLLGVEKIIVVSARYDSNPEGVSTSSTTAIASDSYVSVAAIGNAEDPMTPSVGHMMYWAEDALLPYTAESYWEEQTRGMVYRVRNHHQLKIVDPCFAHLLKVD